MVDHPGDGVRDEADWSVERTVDARDDIAVGDAVRFTKPVGEEDVAAFAAASGDTNPLHLDEEFAAGTRFGRRVVHGTLVSGLVSAALARLPGLSVYLSQEVAFVAPVGVSETLTAEVEVIEALGDGRYRLSTDVYDAGDRRVVEGEAVVLVDERPSDADSTE